MQERQSHSRSEARRARVRGSAAALALTTLLAVGTSAVWVATSVAADPDETGTTGIGAFPSEHGIGACLRVADPPLVETDAVAAALQAEASTRGHLFPELGITTAMPGATDSTTTIALWPNQTAPDVEGAGLAMEAAPPCTGGADGWTFGVTRELLADGATRLLEGADFGSDWKASIEVSMHPADDRVRTTLEFSGPLGISGSCWIDEILTVDEQSGAPTAIATSGDDAGFAGLVACSRFEAEMGEGGAGGQAVALFPSSLTTPDGPTALLATHAGVTQDGIVVTGGSR